jgi:transposase
MDSDILNLSGLVALDIEETEHDYHVFAKAKKRPLQCPHCNSNDFVGFGRKEQLVRDLPIHGKRVGIYIDTKRFKCKSCKRTFLERLPDVDEKRQMTSRLLAWIGKKAIKHTFVSVAEEIGITENTVKAVFNDYINELERTVRFETPQWMGIDEIYLIKPRGVITNIQNNTVVEILHNRNKETILHYLSGLNNKESIKYVAMDMWRPYRDAVEQVLPQAMIVIDKFHVVKMVNEALEKVRKSLRAELEPKQRRYLKNDRLILLKRRGELSDKEEFLISGWLNNHPQLALAYIAKEAFYEIYEANNLIEANRRYAEWRTMIKPEIAFAYSDLIKAFDNWQPYILNYFTHRVTNAYTESLNSLIRVMDRLGRGYSFEALRAKILFSEGVYKHKLKKPKFAKKTKQQNNTMYKMCLASDDSLDDLFNSSEKEVIGNYGADISVLIHKILNDEL